MGLINLVTNLSDFNYYQAKGYIGGKGNFSAKKLPYGSDRPQDGNSGQPYIKTLIPEGNTPPPSPDFILRGGLYAVRDTTEDVLRLGKYFTDLKSPSGLLFTAKQNLLSRTAVRTQASGILNEGFYTPLSTLAEASLVAFGGHVNKQGLNPFDGPGSIGKYIDAIQPSIDINTGIGKNTVFELNDRLNVLLTQKVLGFKSDVQYISLNGIKIDNTVSNILSYTGGPGSILGIGNTNIRYATTNAGAQLTVFRNELIDTPKVLGNGTSIPPIGAPQPKNGFFPNSTSTITYTSPDLLNIPTYIPSDGESVLVGQYGDTTKVGDFRALLIRTINDTSITNAPNYTEKNIEQRINLGDPGAKSGKNLKSYVNGANNTNLNVPKGAASPNSYDKINYTPIYSDKGLGGTAVFGTERNDLVKFAISVLDTRATRTNHIHFRAFLDRISDSYTADWQDTRYIGRGEKFYNYTGFDRKVSLSWTVAAQSKAELIPMYKKLNYLASICAPNYSTSGYMQGNIVRLTIGGYFYEQPGIITGLSYEMNDDNATWEIGIPDEETGGDFYDPSVKELPHLIRVTGFNFIPIHEFVPRLQELEFNDKGELTKNPYGPERYIALNNGVNNNYGDIYRLK